MTKNRAPTPVYLDPGMHSGLEVKGLIGFIGRLNHCYWWVIYIITNIKQTWVFSITHLVYRDPQIKVSENLIDDFAGIGR